VTSSHDLGERCKRLNCKQNAQCAVIPCQWAKLDLLGLYKICLPENPKPNLRGLGGQTKYLLINFQKPTHPRKYTIQADSVASSDIPISSQQDNCKHIELMFECQKTQQAPRTISLLTRATDQTNAMWPMQASSAFTSAAQEHAKRWVASVACHQIAIYCRNPAGPLRSVVLSGCIVKNWQRRSPSKSIRIFGYCCRRENLVPLTSLGNISPF
jgi:hypothetical protein